MKKSELINLIRETIGVLKENTPAFGKGDKVKMDYLNRRRYGVITSVDTKGDSTSYSVKSLDGMYYNVPEDYLEPRKAKNDF